MKKGKGSRKGGLCEYGGKEKYSSIQSMFKHEKGESKKEKKKERE